MAVFFAVERANIAFEASFMDPGSTLLTSTRSHHGRGVL